MEGQVLEVIITPVEWKGYLYLLLSFMVVVFVYLVCGRVVIAALCGTFSKHLILYS